MLKVVFKVEEDDMKCVRVDLFEQLFVVRSGVWLD